jgi:hypothetical protein
MEVIRVPLNGEVEPPASIDPGLPDATSLVILLGSKRGMEEILEEACRASIERPLDLRRGALITPAKALTVADTHQAVLRFLPALRERTASFAEENGP